MEISARIIQALAGIPKKEQYLSEASFGLKYIHRYIESLPDGSRVLEVGSGPCILLSELAIRFPKISFQGIEPVGPGFEVFRSFLDVIKQQLKFDFHQEGYESFASEEKFDLIFSVNVVEHLPSWKHFLKFARSRLKENGKCVVLCPNYGFWYEPHFRLPILFTPALTKSVFRNYIARFEKENESEGLWSSLNFVTWPSVRKECEKIGLQVKFNTHITDDLINRLSSDKEFAARQAMISVPAKIMQKSGALRLLGLKAFHRFHPYMFLELTN